MTNDTIASRIAKKPVVFFDLFHTLTALEVTGNGKPSTSESLGVSREDWNRQLMEMSRERLAGEETDPFTIMRRMARAIDSSISLETIEKVTAQRMERFAGALMNAPAATVAVLQALKQRGKTVGLISNADVTEIAAWDSSPLAPLFDCVVFSCRVGCVKPEKEIYELAMRDPGVLPDDCVFIGDGGSDELAGARAVGMITVMFTGIIKELWPGKIEPRRKDADFVIEDLAEILESGEYTR